MTYEKFQEISYYLKNEIGFILPEGESLFIGKKDGRFHISNDHFCYNEKFGFLDKDKFFKEEDL